ncbi:MAG: histidine phosphatase family protein [Pyrinomonadaceae bacterium]
MSEQTQILLIRHGQSEGNAEGRFGGHSATPLSLRGKKEAAAVAQALGKAGVTAIYSSDLPRAVSTAEPLARVTKLKIVQTAAFRERHVGRMEGLTFEEAAELHPEDYAALLERDFEHILLGGESYRQMLGRAADALDRAVDRHRGGTIAVFTHTGTICILALHLMGALNAPTLRPSMHCVATNNFN